jgi:hypothetical protein
MLIFSLTGASEQFGDNSDQASGLEFAHTKQRRTAAKHSEKVNEVVFKDVETPKVEMDEAWTFVGKKHYSEKMNTKTRELGSG